MPGTIPVRIRANESGWVIESFLIPGSLSEAKSAVYDQQAVRGRSVPVYGYSHSEARTVDLTILIACTDGHGIKASCSTGQEVWQQVNWLKSAVYPRYMGLIFPPTTVYLTVGNFLEVPRGVVTSISITWGDTFDRAGYAMKAEVALTIEEVQSDPSGHTDVEGRGW